MSILDDLYNQENEALAQMEAYRESYLAVEGKIERLTAAKNTIATYKDTVSTQRGAAAGLMMAENWKGTNYTQYQEMVRDGLTSGYNTYYTQVDDAQDELNLEITNLQNECASLLGGIGQVQIWINDLVTAIRNTFN